MIMFGHFSLIAGILLSFADLSTPSCINGTKTIFPGNCTKFYLCENGTEVEKICPPSKIFHPILSECGFSNTHDCSVISSPDLKLLPICIDGVKLPVHSDCQKFIECINGQFEEKKCGMFQKFDPANLECRFTYLVNCNAPTGSGLSLQAPLCVSGTRIPVKYDCKKYDECVNGQYEQRTCRFLEEFDPAVLDCRISIPFQEVNCSAIPGSYVFTTVQPMIVTEIPVCEDGTRVPVKGDCNIYRECVNGQYQERQCNYLQLFDPEILKCRISLPFSQVNCSYIPSYTTPYVEYSTALPVTECVNGAKIPIKNDCHKYIECVNGQYQERECNYPENFDPEIMKCKIFYDANCNSPSTPIYSTTTSSRPSPTQSSTEPHNFEANGFNNIFVNNVLVYNNTFKSFYYLNKAPSSSS